MSTAMPGAEFFLLVDELVLPGEVELVVPLEATVLPDEEPEELEVVVGAGDAIPKLSNMKVKNPINDTHCPKL